MAAIPFRQTSMTDLNTKKAEMPRMKIQLWMRGKKGQSIAKFYRTVTPTQFAQIVAFLSSPSELNAKSARP